MTAAILLRDDFDGSALRRLARQSRDAGQTRRLLALAAIYDGGSRSDAARTGGVGVQIVRDSLRNAEAEPRSCLSAPGLVVRLSHSCLRHILSMKRSDPRQGAQLTQSGSI